MRKLISILLIFTFLNTIGGYYLWFSAMQYGIQKEMEEEIGGSYADQDLALIIIPDKGESGISWIKPGKEFQYKGEMYDVVKTKNLPEKKQYYCLNDNKEKLLIANFNKTRKAKKEAEKRLKRVFNYTFFLQPFTITKNIYPVKLTFTKIGSFYRSNTIDIYSPPPRSV